MIVSRIKNSVIKVVEDGIPDIFANTISQLFHWWMCCHRVLGEA